MSNSIIIIALDLVTTETHKKQSYLLNKLEYTSVLFNNISQSNQIIIKDN